MRNTMKINNTIPWDVAPVAKTRIVLCTGLWLHMVVCTSTSWKPNRYVAKALAMICDGRLTRFSAVWLCTSLDKNKENQDKSFSCTDVDKCILCLQAQLVTDRKLQSIPDSASRCASRANWQTCACGRGDLSRSCDARTGLGLKLACHVESTSRAENETACLLLEWKCSSVSSTYSCDFLHTPVASHHSVSRSHF